MLERGIPEVAKGKDSTWRGLKIEDVQQSGVKRTRLSLSLWSDTVEDGGWKTAERPAM